MGSKLNLKNYNYILFIMVSALMLFGVYVINFADESYTNKQLIGVVAGLIIMITVSLIDYHFICNFHTLLYIFNILLLVAVLIGGKTVGGAKRWFAVTDKLTIQPSELSKIILIVFMATFLSKEFEEERINRPLTIFKFAFFLGIPCALIFLQPDLSTTLAIVFVLVTMLYISGISYKLILTVLLFLVPIISIFIWYVQQPDQKLLYGHQVERIMSFLYPSEYVDEQQANSVMAIGSGTLNGKAFQEELKGTTVTEANLVSEQQTDFIFSVIGEELGFRGSVLIIAIILIIVLQCIRVARRARDSLGMLLASGMACLVGYQSFINIGVATAVLPNTGIPLPFISYGLSSLISISIGMGIVLNVSKQIKKY
ncbi:MAG: rod shape-determining protein RodA [Eubacterium sp.]|nr:rod shape-determining protein RodA [Eubacterium sp.]MCR5293249.1 rod shape-determining protein RodA [Eubacterium sp.]